MPVTGTGCLSLPLENLRTLLADCTAFRTWVAASDAAAAKTHIYLVAVDAPVTSKRPFALIAHREPAQQEMRAIAGGDSQQFSDSGELELLFEDNVSSGNAASHADAELAFLNTVGGIVDEIKSKAGTNGYLLVRRISTLRGPARSHPNERDSEGDYYQVQFAIGWGLE